MTTSPQLNSIPELDASFGIIPLKKEVNSWRVFIIRQTNGNRWGFPKGHSNDEKEPPQETAERELREETGLAVTKYLPIEPFSTRYLCVSHGKYVDKTVTYFVAEAAGTVALCPKEIAEGAWVTLEEAVQKMQFPEMKEMVETLALRLSENAFWHLA